MADFSNYKNPSSTFDSFNGTELKAYMKVTTEYDEYGQSSKFELVELGRLSAISGAEQFSVGPVTAIGFSRPIGIAVGESIVAGSMTFETYNKGFVNIVKDILKKAGIRKINIETVDDEGTIKKGYADISSINDFPMVDLIIIGVKENDKNKKIQKEIKGIRFNRGGSGIGLNQLGVKEQYSYMAISMTDFAPVKGVNEEPENIQNTEFDDFIFA